jgi:starch synthase
MYRNFSAIFLHEQVNRERFSAMHPAIPDSRLHVIPMGDQSPLLCAADAGGDLRSRYRIDTGRPVALFFGGIRPSKGLPELLDAFALVCDEIEATLVIAGHPDGGVDPDALKQQAELLGIADHVVIDARYLPLPEVGPLLRTATVAVFPYRTASASAALNAAYAFERPVIVTDVGALPDAVEHGETGLVVPVAAPGELARAMIKMLSDPSEAVSMGRRGKRLAERRFGWGPIAAYILDVYRGLVRETAR